MNKNVITVLLSIGLSMLAVYGVTKSTENNDSPSQTSGESGVTKTINLSESEYPDLTYAAESAVPAVVYVGVTVTQQYQLDDPFYRFFFGNTPQQREQQGSGSGVIIRSDGYIVTNNHVVANATKVEVTLNDNKKYEAKVIGTDPATDIALIKIDAEGLPTIAFGNSDDLRIGEWVLAVGSPLGYQLRSTVTAGIVSAKGRSMNFGQSENPYQRQRQSNQLHIESFIQTDAAVNPGNSGGALVNKSGELVGINTAIVSQDGAFSGYSFAVPVNIVKKIVGDLIDFGSVKRAVLGISMSDLSPNLAKALEYDSVEDMMKKMKLSSLDGVYIHEVVKGGAADKAGVKSKDVLVAIDSHPIKSPASLQERVNSFHPGDKAVLKVIRGGKELELPVVFLEESSVNGTVAEDGTVMFYGASLKAADKGVEIVSVGNGKIAKQGVEDGFVILYVNDQKVSKPQDVIDIAKKSRRSVFIEGITASGRPGYFGFGKDE